MKRRKEIEAIAVAPRGQIVSTLILDGDVLWASAQGSAHARLARGDLSKVVTGADIGYLVGRVARGVVASARGETQVVRREDGQTAWVLPYERGCLQAWIWRNYVLILRSRSIEFRHADTGEVEAVMDLRRQAAGGGYLSSSDGVLVVCGDDDLLFAVNLASGEELWAASVARTLNERWSVPFPKYGVSFESTESTFGQVAFYSTVTFSWSVLDGSVRWVSSARGENPSWPTVSGGRVYGMGGAAPKEGEQFRGPSAVFALDESTGAELWRTEVPKEFNACFRPKSGVAYRNRLAMPFETGQVAVLDVESGEVVCYYKGGVPLWKALEVDGHLLVATGDGTLLVFDESIWGL